MLARSGRLELGQLALESLAQPGLHQGTEVVDQPPLGTPDGANAIALAAHQARPLQLAQLAADVGLGKPGGRDQGGHIHGPLPELTEQLESGRLTEQTEELAVLLQ